MSGGQPPNGTAKWQLIFSVSGIAIIVLGAFYWVGTIASAVTAAAEANRGLSIRISEMERTRSDSSAFYASTCQQFAKIETQIAAMENAINQAHVDDIRDRAVMWEKLYGQQYPNVYYDIRIDHQIMPC